MAVPQADRLPVTQGQPAVVTASGSVGGSCAVEGQAGARQAVRSVRIRMPVWAVKTSNTFALAWVVAWG